MTSLPLPLAPIGHFLTRFPDWGTDKHFIGPRMKPEEIWNPCNRPTWHHGGLPAEQAYQLTKLKRSKLRLNDQLLPKPQEAAMSHFAIDLPFPAEHPYFSHVPLKDVLPNFDSPDDPRRGNEAKRSPPLHPTAAKRGPSTLVVQKIKGFGHRREIETIFPDSLKMGHLQEADKNFFQLLKHPDGGRQIFYPIPTKRLAPNADGRPPSRRISQKSANALRNIERSHWLPVYSINFTGYGPTNPMKIDNLDDKIRASLMRDSETDPMGETYQPQPDALYPRSVATFIPSTPMEGRKSKTLNGWKFVNQNVFRDISQKESVTEKQERWLLYDREYVNLPTPPYRDPRWKELDYFANPGPALELVEQALALKSGKHSSGIRQTRDELKLNPNRLPERMIQGDKKAEDNLFKNCDFKAETLHSIDDDTMPRNSMEPRDEESNPRIFNLSAPEHDVNRHTLDWRCSWRPGSGVPRPQSILSTLENGFRKSHAHRKFNETFPERALDLRATVATGRKHVFLGLNAQALRGHVAETPSFPC